MQFSNVVQQTEKERLRPQPLKWMPIVLSDGDAGVFESLPAQVHLNSSWQQQHKKPH